jgi:hypothetical protein
MNAVRVSNHICCSSVNLKSTEVLLVESIVAAVASSAEAASEVAACAAIYNAGSTATSLAMDKCLFVELETGHPPYVDGPALCL